MENPSNPAQNPALSSDDHHFRREDRVLRWQRIARQIRAHPADLSIALDTLPLGWRERLVPVPETRAANALDPHDLAAVKLLVGRPKDLALIGELRSAAKLNPEIVRARIALLPVPVELMLRVLDSYRFIFKV